MHLNIIENTKNELLKRHEIKASLEDKKIPSKEEVRKNLSAQLNVPEENIAIIKIKSSFGRNTISVSARQYANKEEMKKIENKHIMKRNFGEEKKETVKEATEVKAEEAK